ncbi:hypothetical protein TWF718_004354 [Orbilia javanica]|uniref:F-box domain-containing protein n=1 Tax=Orbilia javanica TaxID=47235 RepID=A0AAN8N726_9PEZI
MTNILSLPTEILIEIFSDESFTSADLVSCRRVCKYFRNVADKCSINYTFQIDAVSQRTWKLTKYLLRNPDFGKRFKSIKVTWNRRIPRKPQTWALQWHWSPGEIEKIAQPLSRGGRGNHALLGSICRGLNSEALLPFLLLHTPNLRLFDMGDVKLDLLGPYVSAGESQRIYQYCTTSASNIYQAPIASFAPTGWTYSLPDDPENGPNNHYSYLHLHMRLESDWLPGLSNITHLTHGCHRTGGYFDRWPAIHLVYMMFLPRLQTAHFYGASILPPDSSTPLDLAKLSLRFSGQKSTIKHLGLLNCRLRKSDYRTIAQITGSLQSFKCVLEYEEVKWSDYAYVRDVYDLFRLHNHPSLKDEQVVVSRATGKDKDPEDLEKDIDYGNDDDFLYNSDSDGPWNHDLGADQGRDAIGSPESSQAGENGSDIFGSDGSGRSPLY